MCFDVSLSTPYLAPKISQSNRCCELANMISNASHAKHKVESKYCLSSEDSHCYSIDMWDKNIWKIIRFAEVMLVGSD